MIGGARCQDAGGETAADAIMHVPRLPNTRGEAHLLKGEISIQRTQLMRAIYERSRRNYEIPCKRTVRMEKARYGGPLPFCGSPQGFTEHCRGLS